MLLKNEQTDNGTIITISGSIDATTAPNLREEIAKIPDDESMVTLDFKYVEYLSSAGLREILICRQRFDGDRMKIVNVNPDVYDVFKITGFHTMIPMEVTYDEVATYVHLSFKDFLKKKVQNTPDATALVDNSGPFTW